MAIKWVKRGKGQWTGGGFRIVECTEDKEGTVPVFLVLGYDARGMEYEAGRAHTLDSAKGMAGGLAALQGLFRF